MKYLHEYPDQANDYAKSYFSIKQIRPQPGLAKNLRYYKGEDVHGRGGGAALSLPVALHANRILTLRIFRKL
jgi:hypothetical protein